MPAPRRSLLPWAALAACLALAPPLAGCGSSAKCPAGQTRCDGVCRDLTADRDSCGGCGLRCAEGASCQAGVCTCPPSAPLVCGARCADPSTDAAHCGACGHACGLGTCAGGACSCAVGATSCGAAASPECVDTATDRANCGTCGHACTRTGETCAAGTCTCPAAQPTACATACADLQTDEAHCGSCTTACTRAGEVCAAGSCGCPAPIPTPCPTACVNTQTDAANCGGCGLACTRTDAVCVGAACQCPATKPAACATACADTQTDPAHCGSCDRACPAGQVCQAGTCCAACGSLCCPGGCFAHDAGTGLASARFSDCNQPGSQGAAQEAARRWAPGGAPATGQAGLGCSFATECVAWVAGTSPNACGVWCYGGVDLVRGKVKIESISAVCLCPDNASGPWH